MSLNILVLYGYRDYPARATSLNHLYCYGKYANHRCYYVNLAVDDIPWYLRRIKFDLIIFDTLFFVRFKRHYFERLMQKAACLKNSPAVKVMLPQDEFINTDLLCRFAAEFDIDHIFSVAPESEWPQIYEGVDFTRTRIHKVLTGYLDDGFVEQVASIPKPDRDIDIGYCVAKPQYWHGRHGLLKAKIASAFLEHEGTSGLALQISTPDKHAFLGDDWYRFLLRCKYTLGVEGGTSVHDRTGEISTCTAKLLAQNPATPFEEVEAHCFPGLDGQFRLFAISPRHLEACVTRTCQVLIEGDYDGALRPGVHYLELKKDFSNLDEVVLQIQDDVLRRDIVEHAYQDIVASGIYSYRNFVAAILAEVVPNARPGSTCSWDNWIHKIIEQRDRLSWLKVRVLCRVKNIVKAVLN